MNHMLLVVGPDIQKHGVGGVTIHVQRLREYLENNGIEHEFKDYKSNSLWTLLCVISKQEIIHFHVSNPIYQYVLVLLSRLLGKKIVMTLHGDYGRFGKVKNWLVKSAIRMANVPIVINVKSYEACKGFNRNTMLTSAFIPPQREESLQTQVSILLRDLHNNGKKIVSTNASNTAVDKYGKDIYGIDFLVEYYNNSSSYALVVSDPSGNYRKRYETLQSDSIFFIDYPHPYFEVLKQADVFVRNTSTDGDALSVKEALYLGVLTLCTDVVDRPDGVRLFKYSDKESFEDAINKQVEEIGRIENGAEKIIKIYEALLQH